YSKWMTARADESTVSRRVRSLIGRSERLLRSNSDVHFEFGLRAMNRGNFAIAERELELAVSSDPKRSAYTAAWALLTLRKAVVGAPRGRLPEADEVEIEVEQLCDRAVEGMSGVFAP